MREAGLTSDWFAGLPARTVWTVMMELWDRGVKDFDLMIVTARLRDTGRLDEIGGAAALEGAVDATPTSAHAEYYWALMREGYLMRQAENLWRKAKERAPDGALAAVQDLVSGLRDALAGCVPNVRNVAQIGAEALEQWEEAYRIRMIEGKMDYVPGIPLPWSKLTAIYNGVTAGLHVIGARTSVGKTAFALNLVQYWAEKGIPVAVNCLDMEDVAVWKRLIVAKTRVSLSKANFGTLRQEQIEALRRGVDEAGKLPVYFAAKDDVTDLESWLWSLKATQGVRVAVVDYVQLMSMRGTERFDNTVRMGRITAKLKRMQRELRMPIWLLSQLNRECEKEGRPPMPHDLRDTGALEQEAATIALLSEYEPVMRQWESVPPTHLVPWRGRTTDAMQREQKKSLFARHQMKAVRYDLAKNQQGRREHHFPMINYPAYFIFRPGDAEADPTRTQREDGRGKAGPLSYVKRWERIEDDWRKLVPEDEEIERCGGMVKGNRSRTVEVELPEEDVAEVQGGSGEEQPARVEEAVQDSFPT
jgi:replicative DNA helicase